MIIEQIKGGVVCGTPKLYPSGKYKCFYEGTNMNPEQLSSLREVAEFLRDNPRGGVSMTPKGHRIVENIYIDGTPR
jgi:hypothetical protein